MICVFAQVANCTRSDLCISEPGVFNTQPAEMEMPEWVRHIASIEQSVDHKKKNYIELRFHNPGPHKYVSSKKYFQTSLLA